MSILLFGGVVYVFMCLCSIACLSLIQSWSISYHSHCLELYQFNYVWVWMFVALLISPLTDMSALCLFCRWWSLPGTTTSNMPGARMSCGLWRKTGILATCLVSVSTLLKAQQTTKVIKHFCLTFFWKCFTEKKNCS